MNIQFLKQKAAMLRGELKEIEAAIAVIERYSSTRNSVVHAASWSQPEKPEAAVETESLKFENGSPRTPSSTKAAIVAALKSKPDGKMYKREIRTALADMGYQAAENTLTWNLTMHKDTFTSLGGGLWALAQNAQNDA